MSQFVKAGLTAWATKAQEVYGRLNLSKHELFAIRNATQWAIPNDVWKNELPREQTGGVRMWLIPAPGQTNIQLPQAIPHTPIHTDDADAAKIQLQTLERVPVKQLFEDLKDLVKIVAEGHRPSLLCTGTTGTGKSYTVYETLQDMGYEKGEEWVLVKGKTTAYGVYRTLFLNRHKTIVYDDSDDVFAGADTRNLMKAALDSYGKRVLSWQSKLTIDFGNMSPEELEAEYQNIEEMLRSGEDNVKMPSEFDFKGRVIFISNLPISKIEPAIVGRSLTIDVSLTPAEIFERIELIIDKVDPENGSHVTLDEKREVLDYLRNLHEKNPLKLVSLRDFVGALEIKASGNPRWKDLLRYV